MERDYFGETGIVVMPHSAIPVQEAIPKQRQEDFIQECFEWAPFKGLFPDAKTVEDVKALLNDEGFIVYEKDAPKPKLFMPGDT